MTETLTKNDIWQDRPNPEDPTSGASGMTEQVAHEAPREMPPVVPGAHSERLPLPRAPQPAKHLQNPW